MLGEELDGETREIPFRGLLTAALRVLREDPFY